MTTNGTTQDRTTCAVVGGGPAGLVLGLLLARAGVDVTVLEKHADFLRDFRGDTVHPSTLQALDDLGLIDRFLALPHSRVEAIRLPDPSGGAPVPVVDFTRLRVPYPYIAMAPQWDLLDLIADAADAEPGFTLLREHEVTDVVRTGDRVTGVRYRTPHGEGTLRADLVVACDGRWSVVRRAVGLPSRRFPVPFDVWWFKVPTSRPVGGALVPRITAGRGLVTIPREGYLQMAYLGPKGTDAALRARGIEAFRAEVAELVPEVADDVHRLTSMDDVKHLDVRLERLRRWSAPGVLCLGDAAHAMSPIGGIGVNLAVQDAIAAARVLASPLRSGAFRDAFPAHVVARVQARRRLPTAVLQGVQRVMHARAIGPAIAGSQAAAPDRGPRLFQRVPALSALTARLLGIGPRPERVPVWGRRPPTSTP
ncbi:FAD-dependent oxidoreductase [Cellulomonas xiejunii]|uniref:FAD-dependent oxidoreductase n=1 Tax=Cellulomonas xiejunii TaxID=2968083 RepID=A0ABY5KSX2_9CELL|nr:FAD-dependent oxidoreductase [Cellulomonas xiejunii]MCC2316046.1 FAD-dependent oxidoreductase [Cellulomonas xiejunii]MCC2322223.1 FAD-dependent oxidoreductase [Cellulomonas xiejunii]UUI72276.1 FAD-dependent oxidoreductase [Cellulomonas xiejunii]